MQTLILNHYPLAIRQINDIQQIAKAEDIEFSKLDASINSVIKNMSVLTADETGVQRFEKVLGLKPEAGQSLDDRKICIMAMGNRGKISIKELETMLSQYCEGIRLETNINNMELAVVREESIISIHTIHNILEENLPLNIFYHFLTKLESNANQKIMAVPKIGTRLKIKPQLRQQCKVNGKADLKAVVFCGGDMAVKAQAGKT